MHAATEEDAEAEPLLRRLSSSLSGAPEEARQLLRAMSGSVGRLTGLLASHRRMSIGSDDIDRHEYGARPWHHGVSSGRLH